MFLETLRNRKFYFQSWFLYSNFVMFTDVRQSHVFLMLCKILAVIPFLVTLMKSSVYMSWDCLKVRRLFIDVACSTVWLYIHIYWCCMFYSMTVYTHLLLLHVLQYDCIYTFIVVACSTVWLYIHIYCCCMFYSMTVYAHLLMLHVLQYDCIYTFILVACSTVWLYIHIYCCCVLNSKKTKKQTIMIYWEKNISICKD